MPEFLGGKLKSSLSTFYRIPLNSGPSNLLPIFNRTAVTFFNDFQPQCSLLQRVPHDEGDTKNVSTLADGRILDNAGKLDDSAETVVSSGTTKAESVAPNKLYDIFHKMPEQDYYEIKSRSVHNVDSGTLVLGKYRPTITDGLEDWSIPGPDSYVEIARAENAKYFDLGTEWDSIVSKYEMSPDDMFDAFNIPILDDAVRSGKQIKFTHDPRTQGGFLEQEWDY